MKIRTITKDAYNQFAADQENYTFLNCTEQADKLEAGVWSTELIGFFNDQDEMKGAALLAWMPVAKRYQYAMIPAGIMTDWNDEKLMEEITSALKKYLKDKGVLYLNMTPYIPLVERDKNGAIVEGGFNNEHLVEMMKRLGYLYKPPAPGYDTTRDAVWMSVLDLRGKDMDTLLKEMDQQTRWSINRARKLNLTVRPPENEQEFRDFVRMMQATGERNHFDAEDEGYYRRELENYKDNADLLLAYMEPGKMIEAQEKIRKQSEKEMKETDEKLEKAPGSKKLNKRKKVIQEAIDLADQKIEEARELQKEFGDQILLAGCIFLKAGREIIYLHSGAYDQFFKYHAPYAIHYEEIKKAIEEGRDFYNFYGINGVFEKGEDGYSLFDFKRGFGCTVRQLLGTFTLPVRPVEFSLYNKLKKVV